MNQRYVCDCLKICGCSHEDIEKYQNHRQPNRYLKELRRKQLDEVHKQQDKLAILDQLCYEIKEETKHGNYIN